MQAIVDILVRWFSDFFNTILLVIIDVCALVINGIITLISFIIDSLATICPSLAIGTDLIDQFPTPHTAICWLTWIFPVDVLLACVNFYIIMYMLKFFSGPILRILKITS